MWDASAFVKNFRDYDAPFLVKVRLGIANNLRKGVKGCCGNHGEPGVDGVLTSPVRAPRTATTTRTTTTDPDDAR